jgi:hypothetical protein
MLEDRLRVLIFREGVAARVGHDLVLDVARWELTAGDDPASFELTADPRSLAAVEGRGGVKPLTDRDREEIRRNIDRHVLRGLPIAFRSTAVRREEDGGLLVAGELTLAGVTRPLAARLEIGAGGLVTGTVAIVQSQWGIKPYRGMLGALKVRDEVMVEVALRLPDRAT